MSTLTKKKNGNGHVEEFDPEAFRDSIATVDADGKRSWIYPKKPGGRFYNWRQLAAYSFLLVMFGMPFLKWNGQPMFLFNILERKFILFGLTFWPQDFSLFMLAMVSFFVFIVLFTVMFGRIWCGWACPQTVFMEMVFRRIEYWIEGDAMQQRKLAQMPWTAEKIGKRVAKYTLFVAISFLIGNTVMAYIIGIDKLQEVVLVAPTENWGYFSFVLIFSGLFFFVFSYLREQACIAICPYGRLQGVLLNKDSLAVAYDHVRGEPRGKMLKTGNGLRTAEGKGDCIDCKLCVAVCPTGIDIRNGTQLECINCTACIDACDSIMDKIHKPRGLVRIASQSQIEQGQPFRITPRVLAYSAVLLLLLSVLGFSLASRSDVETTILRTPGILYQKTEDGYISNLYNIEFINKTTKAMPLEIRVISHEGARVRMVGEGIRVAPQEMAKGVFFLDLKPEQVPGYKNKVDFEVLSEGRVIDRVTTNFLAP
jgi:cytochrome c oxidase accessory protein FixG